MGPTFSTRPDKPYPNPEDPELGETNSMPPPYRTMEQPHSNNPQRVKPYIDERTHTPSGELLHNPPQNETPRDPGRYIQNHTGMNLTLLLWATHQCVIAYLTVIIHHVVLRRHFFKIV